MVVPLGNTATTLVSGEEALGLHEVRHVVRVNDGPRIRVVDVADEIQQALVFVVLSTVRLEPDPRLAGTVGDDPTTAEGAGTRRSAA